MEIIKLAYLRNFYRLLEASPDTSYLLGLFLISDVIDSINEFVTDFEDTNDHAGAMNATQYTKIDGIVTITPEWVIDDEISIAKGHYFRIRADLLAKLLHQWGVVYEQKPLYITIIINDNSVEVIGSAMVPEKHAS